MQDRKEYFKKYNKSRPKVRRPNHEERVAKFREKRQANPDFWRKYSNEAYHRNKNNERPSNKIEYKLWWNARKRATRKNLPFDIEKEDIIIADNCPCCGDPMTRPSLDQVNPGAGYTKNNIAIICYDCNVIKSYGTSKRHRQIADFMDNFNE